MQFTVSINEWFGYAIIAMLLVDIVLTAASVALYALRLIWKRP